MDTETLTKIVVDAANDITFDEYDINAETKLIGEGGILDSMGLVSLVTEVEQLLRMDHELDISLTDAKAMSRKRSPFRSPSRLVEYIEELIAESSAS